MGGTSPHGAITTILYTNEIGASYDADGNALVNGLLTVYDYENRLGGSDRRMIQTTSGSGGE